MEKRCNLVVCLCWALWLWKGDRWLLLSRVGARESQRSKLKAEWLGETKLWQLIKEFLRNDGVGPSFSLWGGEHSSTGVGGWNEEVTSSTTWLTWIDMASWSGQISRDHLKACTWASNLNKKESISSISSWNIGSLWISSLAGESPLVLSVIKPFPFSWLNFSSS